MSILKTNFEKLRQEGMKECFEALERAFQKFGIDFYLIGARARDIWIGTLEIKVRATTDVDFGIYIHAYEQFRSLGEYLCTSEGFQRMQKEPYSFSFREIRIDLLPFGDIEQDGAIQLDDPPTELAVYGMREVTEHAEVIDGVWKVVTLPGLIVLKLIAFSEKPEREKDLRDVEVILWNYDSIADTIDPDLLWKSEYEDIRTAGSDSQMISARILGRQIGALLSTHATIKERIVDVLKGRLQGLSESEINDIYSNRDQNYGGAVLLKLLLECRYGVEDISQ